MKRKPARAALTEGLLNGRNRMKWPDRLMALYYNVWTSKFGSIRPEDFPADPALAEAATERLKQCRGTMGRRILSSRTTLTEQLRAITKDYVSCIKLLTNEMATSSQCHVY